MISRSSTTVLNIPNYDNNITLVFYENNIDFSNYSTNINEIVIYLSNFNSFNDSYSYKDEDFLRNVTPKYKGNHQPRILDKNYIQLLFKNGFKKQIELSKSHRIYGFDIYYY